MRSRSIAAPRPPPKRSISHAPDYVGPNLAHIIALWRWQEFSVKVSELQIRVVSIEPRIEDNHQESRKCRVDDGSDVVPCQIRSNLVTKIDGPPLLTGDTEAIFLRHGPRAVRELTDDTFALLG